MQKFRPEMDMTRAFRKMSLHLHNRVKDLHLSVANWLSSHYNYIVMPKFESQKMSSRQQRKISCKTVRNMMTWCHGMSLKRLLYISQKYDDCHIIICKEDYTTRTCGACGYITNSVGGGKTFKCTSGACDFIVDRDLNGARNIALKWLSNPLN